MYRSLIFIVPVLLFLNSCSEVSNAPEVGTAAINVTHKDVDSDLTKVVANLSISGMTCSAGCGGKIQQELRALKGVVNTDLDFAEDRKTNVVSVEYDPALVSESDMIKCVGGIGDGNYQVTSAEVVHYKSTATSQSGSQSGTNMITDNFGKVFQILNLLQSVERMME